MKKFSAKIDCKGKKMHKIKDEKEQPANGENDSLDSVNDRTGSKFVENSRQSSDVVTSPVDAPIFEVIFSEFI